MHVEFAGEGEKVQRMFLLFCKNLVNKTDCDSG